MNFSRFFSKANVSLVISTALLLVSYIAVAGQSSLNSPQQITRRETSVNFNGDKKEQFLSFAGRGAVSVTFDVKATSDNAGVYVDFLNKSGKSLSQTEVVQATDGGTDRVVKKISLGKNFQTVVLKLKSIAYGSRSSYPGNLKITLSGDIDGLREDNPALENPSSDKADFESVIELNSAGRSIDAPKFIITRQTVLNFKGNDEEQFLGFVGRGRVEITYDIKARGTNAGAYVTLIDENGDELAGQEVVQAINKGTARVTQSVDLEEKKLIIIKVVSIKYGGNPGYPGTLKITLNQGFVKDSE